MDKNRELVILRYVYPSSCYEALGIEEPDFIVTDLHNSKKFGVEITEFFYDECYARLRNIPHYIENIIDKQQYFNKGDDKKLPVEEVTINPHTQAQRQSKMIINDKPSRVSVGERLSDLISQKEAKLPNYKKKENDVFLVIYDDYGCLDNSEPDRIHSSVFCVKLIQCLLNSEFNEVIFITRSHKNRVFYRLQEVNIIALSFLTLEFAKSYIGLINEEKLFCYMNLLYGIGASAELAFINGDVKIVINDVGFHLTDKSGTLCIEQVLTSDVTLDFEPEEFIPDTEEFELIKSDYFDFLNEFSVTNKFDCCEAH